MRFAAACAGLVGISCSLVLIKPPAAAAQQPASSQATAQAAPQAGDTQTAIEAAKSQFQPITAARLSAARSELDAALADFDRWLSQSKANADFWRPRVGWSELAEELKRGDQAHPAAIRDMARRFAGNAPGEGSETDALYFYNQFAKVRDALGHYANVLEAAQSANAGKDWFDAQLTSLGEHLSKYRQNLDPSDADKVGEILGRLQDTQQTPGLAARVRQEFGYPNFYAGASAGFVSKIGSTPSESLPEPETKPYQDNILGTCIVGTRTTYFDSRTTQLAAARITSRCSSTPSAGRHRTPLATTIRSRSTARATHLIRRQCR